MIYRKDVFKHFTLILISITLVIGCDSDDSNIKESKDFIGDVVLKTQKDIDDLGKKEYITISESVFITPESPNDIKNLSALHSMTCISGDLIIRFTDINDMSGFNNLTKIEGGLYMNSNKSLTSLMGLDNLKSVGTVPGRDMLVIEDSDLLINLDALTNLTSINGLLWIANNNALDNIKGLKNLSIIKRHLWIMNNPILNSLEGLEKLELLGESEGSLLIDDNNTLLNLKGLNNLSIIRGYIQITNNDALININELSNLTKTEYNINIQDNSSLTNLDGFVNLSSTGGFTFQNNAALTNFCGLKSFFEEAPSDISYTVNGNLYNPTEEDIIGGVCSN